MPSAGAGGFYSKTNTPTIYNQGGMGTTVGGSGSGAVLSVGAEYNMLIDQEAGKVYHGRTYAVCAGLYPSPVEMHGEVGYTFVAGANIYDVALWFVDLLIPKGD